MPESRNLGAGNTKDGESIFWSPRMALLDEKQWAYIQKRYHMTPREVQVAKLICQGLKNGEISGALKIRHGTVKTHLRNIYRRVRVKSKIQMLLKFVDDATGFSAKSGIAPPIPIAEVKKPTTRV